MEVLGFWIFASVVYAVDGWLFTKGYETFFFKHKTDDEKRLKNAAIKRAEAEVAKFEQ